MKAKLLAQLLLLAVVYSLIYAICATALIEITGRIF